MSGVKQVSRVHHQPPPTRTASPPVHQAPRREEPARVDHAISRRPYHADESQPSQHLQAMSDWVRGGPAAPAQEGAPSADDRRASESSALASHDGFRALAPEIQASALDHLSHHEDEGARKTLTELVKSPGFQHMGATDPGGQQKLLDLVGGTNTALSEGARKNLGDMMGARGFREGDGKTQGDWLGKYMSRQDGAGWVAKPDNPARDRFETKDRGTVNHAFYGSRNGVAANRTDVKVGGQTIPVFSPRKVTEKIDGKAPHLPSTEQVAKSLAALPPELRSRISQVNISPTRSVDDARYNVTNRATLASDTKNPGPSSEAKTYEDWLARHQYTASEGQTEFRAGASALASSGTVNFFPSRHPISQGWLDETMVHESAHIFSAQVMGVGSGPSDKVRSQPWQTYDRVVQADGVRPSSYARNSLNEDFSETMALLHAVQGTPQEAEVRALIPRRADFVDTYMPQWRNQRRTSVQAK